jgi:hypothetical protein
MGIGGIAILVMMVIGALVCSGFIYEQGRRAGKDEGSQRIKRPPRPPHQGMPNEGAFPAPPGFGQVSPPSGTGGADASVNEGALGMPEAIPSVIESSGPGSTGPERPPDR